jgi:hypothetical protein
MKNPICALLVTASLATLPALPAQAQGTGFGYDNGDNSMTLICWGEGKRPAMKFLPGYQWDKDDHRFRYKAMSVMGNQHFDSDVQIELHDGWGRIHLHGKLLPPIRSGGNNGWWDLENVVVGADRITGSYRLNGLNKPRVEINRRNGRIKISGQAKFKGECHTGEFGDPRNRF